MARGSSSREQRRPNAPNRWPRYAEGGLAGLHWVLAKARRPRIAAQSFMGYTGGDERGGNPVFVESRLSEP